MRKVPAADTPGSCRPRLEASSCISCSFVAVSSIIVRRSALEADMIRGWLGTARAIGDYIAQAARVCALRPNCRCCWVVTRGAG